MLGERNWGDNELPVLPKSLVARYPSRSVRFGLYFLLSPVSRISKQRRDVYEIRRWVKGKRGEEGGGEERQ